MDNTTIILIIYGGYGIASVFLFLKAWKDGYERGRDEGYRAGYRTGVEEVTQVMDAEKREEAK